MATTAAVEHCAAFYMISTDSVLAQFLCISRAFVYVVAKLYWPADVAIQWTPLFVAMWSKSAVELDFCAQALRA